jgi:hypothetical protein
MRSKLSVTFAISVSTALLSLAALSALADVGIYTVPVTPDLQGYAAFPIDVTYTKTSDQISLQYNLPETLTGVAGQTVSLQGTAPQASASAPITLSGPQASASCTASGVGLTCNVTLQSVNTDFARLQSLLQTPLISSDELNGRLAVAHLFAREPVGVVSYQY